MSFSSQSLGLDKYLRNLTFSSFSHIHDFPEHLQIREISHYHEQSIIFQCVGMAKIAIVFHEHLVSMQKEEQRKLDLIIAERNAAAAAEKEALDRTRLIDLGIEDSDSEDDSVDVEDEEQVTLTPWHETLLKIGIIGYGNVGSRLVKTLLQVLPPGKFQLVISTRTAESHQQEFNAYSNVSVVFDNHMVFSSCAIVFLCATPSNFPRLEDEICKSLGKTTFIFSIVAGVSMARLQTHLRTDLISRPYLERPASFNYDSPDFKVIYKIGKSVSSFLEDNILPPNVETATPLDPKFDVFTFLLNLHLVYFALVRKLVSLPGSKFQVRSLMLAVLEAIYGISSTNSSAGLWNSIIRDYEAFCASKDEDVDNNVSSSNPIISTPKYIKSDTHENPSNQDEEIEEPSPVDTQTNIDDEDPFATFEEAYNIFRRHFIDELLCHDIMTFP